jgi:hypothetical protein
VRHWGNSDYWRLERAVEDVKRFDRGEAFLVLTPWERFETWIRLADFKLWLANRHLLPGWREYLAKEERAEAFLAEVVRRARGHDAQSSG